MKLYHLTTADQAWSILSTGRYFPAGINHDGGLNMHTSLAEAKRVAAGKEVAMVLDWPDPAVELQAKAGYASVRPHTLYARLKNVDLNNVVDRYFVVAPSTISVIAVQIIEPAMLPPAGLIISLKAKTLSLNPEIVWRRAFANRLKTPRTIRVMGEEQPNIWRDQDAA